MELGPEDVSRYRGVLISEGVRQASMESRPEDVSLLERCAHFRGCYVQASRPEESPHIGTNSLMAASLCLPFSTSCSP